MKKFAIITFMGLLLLCSLAACKAPAAQTAEPADNKKTTSAAKSDDNSESSKPSDSSASQSPLHLLCDSGLDSACSTAEGYYYLTGDTVKLNDGNYGSHLMYMDYASCREIYLCSTAGCSHNSADCPAVFLYDDFPTMSSKLFIYRDSLYILSREYDNDGVLSMSAGSTVSYATGEEVPAEESRPAVLYRAKLDGTDRRKIHTFDAALTLEDIVLGDAGGIYVIAKKLSSEKTGEFTYTTSSQRKLLFLDPDSGDTGEICSLDFDDGIPRQIVGCTEDALILCGTDYGRDYSTEEYWDDSRFRELYENSSTVYSLLYPKTGMLKEICRIPNKTEHSCRFIGQQMYLSYADSGDIQCINLQTGEQTTLCTLTQNLIMDVIGDTLCCRTWNLSEDFTWYFVDTGTGTVSHSTLVNRCNGWDLEFRAESGPDVLVIYDYDATAGMDGSYEIHQYRYALIPMTDLLSGNPNYRPITMIGTGK